jgi:hypothetical protein
MYKLIACSLILGFPGPVLRLILRFFAGILSFFAYPGSFERKRTFCWIFPVVAEVSNLIPKFLQSGDKVKK